MCRQRSSWGSGLPPFSARLIVIGVAGCWLLLHALPALADSNPVAATAHPLVAKYTCDGFGAATVYVEFGENTLYGRRTSALAPANGGGRTDILVAGMKPLTTYHMRCVYGFPDGHTGYDADHIFTTAAAPAFPVSVTHTAYTPGSGVELLDMPVSPMPAVTDLDGNLIWYYPNVDPGSADYPLKLLDNGDFLFLADSGTSLREVDLVGKTVRELGMQQLLGLMKSKQMTIKPFAMHHDFALLPNEHIMLLLAGYQVVDTIDYPQGVKMLGDMLVELDENWNPVWSWNSFDHLDPNRHPWWGAEDWTHSNAVLYDPRDHNVVVSSRHQSWVFKIDYRDGAGTGNILWRLGYQGDFTLIGGGPADWFWSQHYPTFLSFDSPTSEHLGVLDNGNFRTNDVGQSCGKGGTPTMPCYSRAVILQVDEAAKTAQVVWQDNPGLFASWGGSIGLLPNGNVEFDFAGIGKVMEVTHDPVPQLVWELDTTFAMYRGRRIPSLYPGVQW